MNEYLITDDVFDLPETNHDFQELQYEHNNLKTEFEKF